MLEDIPLRDVAVCFAVDKAIGLETATVIAAGQLLVDGFYLKSL
jgi:hypothetical protein